LLAVDLDRRQIEQTVLGETTVWSWSLLDLSAFKDHEVTYVASNNIKSIGKSIGVKVSPILFVKVSVLVLGRNTFSA